MGISAVVLAGGQGARIGGVDKGWLLLDERPLIQRVIERLLPQVDEIIISCNRNLAAYQALGFPVVQDQRADYRGPLSGIVAAAPLCTQNWIQLCPCDLPNMPLQLSAQLLDIAQRTGANAVIPRDRYSNQYLCALIDQQAIATAQRSLDSGNAAVKGWLLPLHHRIVDIKSSEDAFFNINTQSQLNTAADAVRNKR